MNSIKLCKTCEKELLETFHLVPKDEQLNVCRSCGALIRTDFPDGAIYCEKCAEKLHKCQRCGNDL